MKKIFLADSEKSVREALCLILEHQTDFQVIGQSGTPEGTLAQVCQYPPDVILLDWNLPGLHPQRLLNALHKCCPETIIIATSVKPEQEAAALRTGVSSFILKQLPPEQFIVEINKAIQQQESPE